MFKRGDFRAADAFSRWRLTARELVGACAATILFCAASLKIAQLSQQAFWFWMYVSPHNILCRAASWTLAVAVLASAGRADAEEARISDARQSFREVLAAWDKWKQETNGSLPMCELKSVFRPAPDGRSPGIMQVGWDEHYYFANTRVKMGKADNEFVTIANPRYAARIARPGAGKWRVVTLSPRDKVEQNSPLSLWLKGNPVEQALSPNPLIGRLLASGQYRVVKAERLAAAGDGKTNPARRRFTLEPTSETGTFLKRLIIVVSEDHGLLPIEFSLTQAINPERRPGETMTSVFKILGWRRNQGIWKWDRARWEGSSSPASSSVEYTWTIPSPEHRFDHKRCYLSYYGLPEPSFSVSRRNWTWILVGCGIAILAGGVLFVAYRFRR